MIRDADFQSISILYNSFDINIYVICSNTNQKTLYVWFYFVAALNLTFDL